MQQGRGVFDGLWSQRCFARFRADSAVGATGESPSAGEGPARVEHRPADSELAEEAHDYVDEAPKAVGWVGVGAVRGPVAS